MVGLQALQLAGDPRVKAVVVMHSGIFMGDTKPMKGISVSKSLLKTLHTPVLYLDEWRMAPASAQSRDICAPCSPPPSR